MADHGFYGWALAWSGKEYPFTGSPTLITRALYGIGIQKSGQAGSDLVGYQAIVFDTRREARKLLRKHWPKEARWPGYRPPRVVRVTVNVVIS